MSGRPLFIIVLFAAAGWAASPIPKEDSGASSGGARLYQTHCAACHGAEARGDGPRAIELPIAPPDLTRIAQRNGGIYPADRVYRTVDGRGYVKGHGGAGMPAWGDAFLVPDDAYSETKVRARLRQIVNYLASLQTTEPVQKQAGPERERTTRDR